MAKIYKLRLISDPKLFAGFPPIDIYIKRDAGYFWDDVQWSMLPGYLLENQGPVQVGYGYKGGAWWLLNGSIPNGRGSLMCYGILYDLPENWVFKPGQSSQADITFGGSKFREAFPGKGGTAWGTWEFVSCC